VPLGVTVVGQAVGAVALVVRVIDRDVCEVCLTDSGEQFLVLRAPIVHANRT
jgi:hypothetical protein